MFAKNTSFLPAFSIRHLYLLKKAQRWILKDLFMYKRLKWWGVHESVWQKWRWINTSLEAPEKKSQVKGLISIGCTPWCLLGAPRSRSCWKKQTPVQAVDFFLVNISSLKKIKILSKHLIIEVTRTCLKIIGHLILWTWAYLAGWSANRVQSRLSSNHFSPQKAYIPW